jgi:hypothetical protein
VQQKIKETNLPTSNLKVPIKTHENIILPLNLFFFACYYERQKYHYINLQCNESHFTEKHRGSLVFSLIGKNKI